MQRPPLTNPAGRAREERMAIDDSTKAATKRNRRRRARAKLAALPGRPAVRTVGLNEKAAKVVRRLSGMVHGGGGSAAARAYLCGKLAAATHRERGRLLARWARCVDVATDRDLIAELVLAAQLAEVAKVRQARPRLLKTRKAVA